MWLQEKPDTRVVHYRETWPQGADMSTWSRREGRGWGVGLKKPGTAAAALYWGTWTN